MKCPHCKGSGWRRDDVGNRTGCDLCEGDGELAGAFFEIIEKDGKKYRREVQES